MTRFRAFLTHLSLSAMVVGGFVSAAFFLWYPSPLLSLQGGLYIVGMLMVVDVILGPVLTLIVFKPGKPSLKFDLTIIAAVQIAAFFYGASVVYSERPVFLTFAYSQFFVVRNGDLQGEPPPEMAKADRFGALGPTVAYAPIPESLQGPEAIIAILSGDLSLANQAGTYQSLPNAMDILTRESLKPADVLADIGDDIRFWAAQLGVDPETLYYFHILGRQSQGVAVVDPKHGKLIGIIDRNLMAFTASAEGSNKP